MWTSRPFFFFKGCRNSTREVIKEVLQVHNETLNEKYLCMPSDAATSTMGLQIPKNRVWNRVQGWMEQTLSAGGKDVLIKPVAQAVPTFFMSCFKLPIEGAVS